MNRQENALSMTERLSRLGLACDAVPTDRLCSATAALACFPMYMVANVHAWSSDKQFGVPLLDLPGFEQIRESFAIGRAEATLDLTAEHRAALGTLMGAPKPADLIIYEYALDTLQELLSAASPTLASTLRAAVARMIVAVARASGKGLLGSGPKVSLQERECIDQIILALSLEQDDEATTTLAALDEP